ncbi:MAG: glycosyltransferase family 39 protein [Flavobacteriales bacterium]|nr:glycosyltransferase family 39 protein [Flavobacteriales bacterium]
MNWREHIRRYGIALLPGEGWMRWSLLVLLLLAAVLRFWDLPHLPYTHDELSALIRMYPTLGETIQKGVVELDTHPPGVQVFEWLWTRIFSLEEADVKLPFILMSLLSILLVYRFALAWTGAGPALFLATLMAALQYSVLYGQIARPYAAGLFTTALLADQLTRYVAFSKRRTLVGVGIATVLSAYTHHFSLMLAALMVATGLFLIERTQRRSYLIMCGIAILLYLPNIPIFLAQLGQGGLTEWLQPPDHGWLGRYAWFIVHNSNFLAALLGAAVVASVVLTLKNARSPSPHRWFLLLWGLLPLIIGYAYSVWRAPVLQYSMLLFSFPYLVLFLAQGLVHAPRKWILIGCGAFACVAVHSLVHERKHYTLFYRSKYEGMLREGIAAVKELGKDRTLVLYDAPGNVLQFYLRLWDIRYEDIGYVNIRDGFDQGRLDSLLIANAGRTVIYGQNSGSRPEHPALIQHRFPLLVERQDFTDGQVFRFSATPVPLQWFDRDTVFSLGPEGMSGPWNLAGDLPTLTDSSGTATGWDYTGREFGIEIRLRLDSVVLDPSDQVEVIAEVDGYEEGTEASVVADVRSGDSTVFYRGGRLDAGHRHRRSAAMVVTVSPSDVQHDGPLTLLAYIYSPSKGALHVRRMTVMVRQGDPVRHATLEPVPWLGRFPAK